LWSKEKGVTSTEGNDLLKETTVMKGC
jgi:hypothetical protein